MVRLVQITDCHLGAEKFFISHGVNTYESFSKVLHEISTKSPPSLIIASGDISSSGEKCSYQLFSDVMESSLIPYRWLPGNHDDFFFDEQYNCAALCPGRKARKLGYYFFG